MIDYLLFLLSLMQANVQAEQVISELGANHYQLQKRAKQLENFMFDNHSGNLYEAMLVKLAYIDCSRVPLRFGIHGIQEKLKLDQVKQYEQVADRLAVQYVEQFI